MKRYTVDDWQSFHEHHVGSLVMWDDHAAEVQTLRAALEAIAEVIPETAPEEWMTQAAKEALEGRQPVRDTDELVELIRSAPSITGLVARSLRLTHDDTAMAVWLRKVADAKERLSR